MIDETVLLLCFAGLILSVIVGSLLLSLLRIVQVCRSKRQLGWSVLVPILILGVGIAIFLEVVPDIVDQQLNPVLEDQKPYLHPPSLEAIELHRKLWIADLHADSLLWPSRNMNALTSGHVDIPKLLKGNVALQAFTIVTSSPLLLNFDSNKAPQIYDDTITIKAISEFWGIKSITSLAARTLFQAHNFHQIAKESEGKFHDIKSRKDLEHYTEIRTRNNITAGFLGIEGLHALDGDISNVDRFYDAGIRMMAPVHFFDNQLGGSAHGIGKTGLTPFGKQVIRRMEEKQILIDLSHSSEKLIDDVINFTSGTLMVSHTGVRAVCPSPRNLRDDHLIAIAKTGGVIGVAYFRPAQCGENLLESIVKTIIYLKNLVGVSAIGLGSDYDGTVAVPFDTTGIIYITDSLLKSGFTNEEIELIMGKNTHRMLLNNLPVE